MKRKFLIALVAIFGASHIFAGEDTPQRTVVISVKNHGAQNGNGIPRTPMRVPSLYIEGHTLSFDEFYLGYTLQLVQDDQVVNTYQILTMDDLELPDTLSGEYEIQLIGPEYTFVGIVEL